MPILKPLWLVLGSALLAGCVSSQIMRTQVAATAGCGPVEAGVQTRMGMIRKLMDDGQPYAALSHLESSGMKGPAADDLRADILRRLGRADEARKLYQSLLTTCLAGAGNHGLGLIAGQAGDLPASLGYLEKARQTLPADAQVRNDYGYALLLAGRFGEARFELLTAHDLDRSFRKIAFNLLLLFELQGDTKAVEALVAQHQITTKERQQLGGEVTRLRGLRSQAVHNTAPKGK